jgi:hypothetical protein
MQTDGQAPRAAPALVGETSVTIHVLHFSDGTASSACHVTAAGQGHLLNRPRTLAEIVHGHANEIAVQTGLILPPGTT